MEGSRDSHSFGDVLAVDLPGHGQRFGDEIRRITMEHYVEAVVTPTEVMRLDEVVLVGHGFAGTFLPRAAMELGHRVKGMVLVGADLPPRAGRPTTGCPGGTG
jgi:pimeloyl-ACP methyl ester carboxylesterase